MNKLKRSVSTLLALVMVATLAGGCTKSARRSRMLATADRYFAAEQYDQAEATYLKAFRLLSPPSPIAVAQLGLIYAAEGRTVAAMPYLNFAATNQPGNVAVQLAQAQGWAALGQSTQSKAAAARVLKLQPGNMQALLLLAESATNTSEGAVIRQEIQQWQKQDQDRASYHLALGALMGKDQNLPGAEAELRKAQGLEPKSEFVYYYAANLCEARNDRKGAEDAFKMVSQLAPPRSPLQMQYVKFLRQVGDLPGARAVLNGIIAKAPDYLPALKGIMEISFAERKFDECNADIARVLERDSTDFEALMERGRVSMARGQAGQAARDFERMIQIFAKNPRPDMYYQLALADVLDGNRASAVSALGHALALDSRYTPAKLLLADLDIRDGNLTVAFSLLSQMEGTRQPPAVEEQVKLLKARAYLSQNQTAQAVAVFEGLEKSYPEDPQIPYLKGKAYIAANQLDQARTAFTRSFALATNFVAAFEELVDLDLAQGRSAAAEERVRKEIALIPKSAAAMLLLGKVQLVETNLVEAEKSLQKAIELNPKLPAPYLLLAKLYIQGHRDQEALANLTALVAQTNNVSAYLQMGMIHEQNMDFDKAREAYEKALTINSNNTSALNNLAYVYSERLHQPDKALPLAERNWVLAGADPIQSAFAADTLGWILLKHGDYPRAQTLLQESADRQPGDPEVRYHLGMAHYMMGEEVPARLALQEAVAKGDYEGKAEAKSALAILNIDPKQANANDRAELEKQLAAKPGDAIALMKLAEMEERDGHPDKAAAQYEAAIKANAQNLRAMVRLAQLDSGPLHQPQKGLDLAKNAHRISPEDANVSALLGRLDFEAKDYANARDLLEDASRRMPGQPDLLHDLAWSYFSVGDLNQAQATMLGAVGTSVKFEKLDDARQFLDMLSAYSSPGEPASASRVQAVLQANGTYAPALLASGSVQERQGKNNEAEQQYEKVLADFPLLAPARRQLAILYTRDNNDAKALQNLDKARAAFPDDAEVIRSSGIVAFRQNDFQKSSQWLNQVVQKGPDDPYTDYCLGMDYYALKQMTTAKKYLQLAINSKRTDRFVEDAKSVLAGLK